MSQPKVTLTTIYLVRHAETESNVKDWMEGHTDSPLTPKGEAQAQALAEEFKDIQFDAVFSSDMTRTQRTAEMIKLDRQLAINTTQALRERFIGPWEGKPTKVWQADNREILQKLAQLADKEQLKFDYGNGMENDGPLFSRFVTFLREVAVAYPGKTLLIVSHAVAIRTFLIHTGWVTSKEIGFDMENTGYVKLTTDGIDFFVQETKGIKRRVL